MIVGRTSTKTGQRGKESDIERKRNREGEREKIIPRGKEYVKTN